METETISFKDVMAGIAIAAVIFISLVAVAII